MVFGFLRRGGVFDRVERRRLDVRFVEVSAPRALLNLIGSCFGGLGVPFLLLSMAVERRARYVLLREFQGSRFQSGVYTRGWLRQGVILRSHVVMTCTGYVVSLGSLLLERASTWDAPIIIVCQLPTGALYRVFEPPHELLAKALKFKGDGGPYAPSQILLDRLYREVVNVEYPYTYATCTSENNLEQCSGEMAIISLDDHIATLLYAVNIASAKHLLTGERRPITTNEITLKPSDPGVSP